MYSRLETFLSSVSLLLLVPAHALHTCSHPLVPLLPFEITCALHTHSCSYAPVSPMYILCEYLVKIHIIIRIWPPLSMGGGGARRVQASTTLYLSHLSTCIHRKTSIVRRSPPAPNNFGEKPKATTEVTIRASKK